MTTSASCGSTGSISLGGEVTRWNVVLEEDTPEVTNMASPTGYKEYIACLKSASGSFDSKTSCGAIGSHTGVDFINDNETISMDIIITDLTLEDDVEKEVVFRYSFVSTGEVTIA